MGGSRSLGGGILGRGGEKIRSGLRKRKGKKSTWYGTGIGGEPAPTSAPTWMDGGRFWVSFHPLSPLSVVSAK